MISSLFFNICTHVDDDDELYDTATDISLSHNFFFFIHILFEWIFPLVSWFWFFFFHFVLYWTRYVCVRVWVVAALITVRYVIHQHKNIYWFWSSSNFFFYFNFIRHTKGCSQSLCSILKLTLMRNVCLTTFIHEYTLTHNLMFVDGLCVLHRWIVNWKSNILHLNRLN